MANGFTPIPYDSTLAVSLGAFLTAAYDMFAEQPPNITPPKSPSFPAGWTLHSWVQMQDFLVGSTGYSFYGVLAQNDTDPNDFVLAIRGTSTPEEWWDDLTSIVPVAWTGAGKVGFGFNNIYQTMRIVRVPQQTTASVAPHAQSLENVGSFARQVAAAVGAHPPHTGVAPDNAPTTQSVAPPAHKRIRVVGHSLGSALATLYVAENAAVVGSAVETPMLCTFASPRVGDPDFAAAFGSLPVTSWRIVNELDIVPTLPFIGFQHIQTLHLYNSGNQTHWSLACWHSLATYLHLLDPRKPLLASCQPWFAAAAMGTAALSEAAQARHALVAAPGGERGAAAAVPIAVSVPSTGGATIDITIKVR